MRRLAIGLLVTLAGLMMLGAPNPATAADDDADVGRVDVLQVSGLIDRILVESIRDAIDAAEADGSQALVLQVNSRGTVISDDEVEALLDDLTDSTVPIAIWVGPNGARFYGPAAQMLTVADITGMSPGTRIGYLGSVLNPQSAEIELSDDAVLQLKNGSGGLDEIRGDPSDPAKPDLGLLTETQDIGVPTITSMIEVLDGQEVDGQVLETTEEAITDSGQVRRDTTSTVRFSKLSLTDQLFHTVASPPVAYLLLLTGLALIIFEFFTAGVGVAAVVGAVCLVLSTTGLSVLPTRTWAIVVILLSMVAFAVDVQVGIPRFWTGVGICGTIIGSLFLFDSLPGTSLRPSWIALLTGIGGITLTFIVGMPNMVRTRFATPTIGREWMIGEEGTVISDVDPEGVVEVGAGRWRALTNRATPVMAGDRIRVAAIDGVTLEVEPLEGAARDYRERRGSSDQHVGTDADATTDEDGRIESDHSPD